MTIGDKLELLRTVNKITKANFCEQVGMSRPYYDNLIAGKAQPTVSLINSVCYLFNINKDWLIDDSNENLNFLRPENNMNDKFIKIYSLLSDDYKKIVDDLINNLLEIQKKNKKRMSNNVDHNQSFKEEASVIESTNIPIDRIIAANNMNLNRN